MSKVLFWLYGKVGSETIRRQLRKWILALEGGPARSATIRAVLKKYYRVEVGMHSIAPCLTKPQVLHPGTIIGQHCVIADSVRTFTRDHPMRTKSSHGIFYNPALGRSKASPLVFGQLHIGNGVRIGDDAIILSPTRKVGDGAIIGAGAVVYSDVPPCAIVEGNPARVVGFRYPPAGIEDFVASRGWERSPVATAEATP